MRTLAGQVAIVTGASSGIGAATAHELARRGAKVVLAARRAEELAGIARAITEAEGQALAVPTDVTDPQQIRRLVEQAEKTFGRVDVLVNNAGIGGGGQLATTPPEEIVQALDVNLVGAVLATRAVLPGMIARRHGAIVSVASVAGLIAVAPVYSATKFGLRGFSLALRRELQGKGISVSLVSPGFVRTPMNADMRRKLPGPEVVARAIARQVLHPRRELIVPRGYRMAVWVEHVLPGLVDRFARPRT